MNTVHCGDCGSPTEIRGNMRHCDTCRTSTRLSVRKSSLSKDEQEILDERSKEVRTKDAEAALRSNRVDDKGEPALNDEILHPLFWEKQAH